jgi:hypothetical protein
MPARRLPVGQEDGNFKEGKSLRRIQIAIEFDVAHLWYELRAYERRFISREILSRPQPNSSTIAPRDKSVLQRWLRRRYDRTALPTEFAERVKPAEKLLRKKLSKTGDLISGVWVVVGPDAELESAESYSVLVILSMTVQAFADAPSQRSVVALSASLSQEFARCPGIELVGVEVRSEDDITLDDLRKLTRWDYEDHLSYRAGDDEAHPPQF